MGVLIIRILLFRVLYQGPLFSETPKFLLEKQQKSNQNPGREAWSRAVQLLVALPQRSLQGATGHDPLRA